MSVIDAPPPPVTVPTPPSPPIVPPIAVATEFGRPRRWTRDECDLLEEQGLLPGRYELLDGKIIVKMGQNEPHALTIALIFAYLIGIFGARRVRSQATMEVRQDDRVVNRPEPDVFVLREELGRVATGQEVLLAVEVSDTTLTDDTETKARLYARAGVAEYWVLDLNRRTLIAHRRPDAETGEWAEKSEYAETVEVAPLSAPDRPARVADLLP